MASTGFTFSKISTSPPTNIVSSPVIAFGVLPVTGASRKWTHFFARLVPISTAHSTPMVDISMTIVPGLIESAILSWPKRIPDTSSPAVTIVMMISDSLASSMALLHIFAPRDMSSVARSGVRFHTQRSPHLARILRHIGTPMRPRPMKPIRIEEKVSNEEIRDYTLLYHSISR
jgi:hypothetical protein